MHMSSCEQAEGESDVTIVVHGDTVVGSVLHVNLIVDGEEAAPDDEEDVRWYRMVADEWQEVAGGMSYTVSQEDEGCALRVAYSEVGCVTAQITAAVCCPFLHTKFRCTQCVPYATCKSLTLPC